MGRRPGHRSIAIPAAIAVVLGLAGAASALGTAPSQKQARVSEPLVRIRAEFRQAERATHYTVVNTGTRAGLLVDLDAATYVWFLIPPAKDEECDNLGETSSTDKEFVWHHGNKGDPVSDDGCSHEGEAVGDGGHLGRVNVTVKDANWNCLASYIGTEGDDGSTIDFGADGACDSNLISPPPPPPPPPPPRPKARDCDDEKAALAKARATVAELQSAWAQAKQAEEKAKKELRETDNFPWLKLGFKDIFRTDVLDALFAAQSAAERAEGLVNDLRRQRYEAEGAVTRARDALARCLDGKSISLRLVRRVQAASSSAVCGSQKVALATAQARLSVYQWVSRSFRRLGLPRARAKLIDAQRILARARARLPASPTFGKQSQALGQGIASLGRAAAAVGDLDAVGRRIGAKVKPAQRQVAKAKSALAACQK